MTTQKLDRRHFLPVLAGGLTALGGCKSGGKSAAVVHQMGERVQVGPLIYTILEADWLGELPGQASPRLPKHKFLQIRLTVTNAGNKERSVPLLNLEDEQGNATIEESDGQGVEEWLGVLREVGPTETIQGRLLYDVAQKNYLLRITDGGEPDKEITTVVNIPLKLREQQRFEPGGEKRE